MNGAPRVTLRDHGRRPVASVVYQAMGLSRPMYADVTEGTVPAPEDADP